MQRSSVFRFFNTARNRWRQSITDRYLLRIELAAGHALLPLALLGLIAGLITGLVICLFRWSIESGQIALLQQVDAFEQLPPLQRFCLPLIGAMCLIVLYQLVSAEHRKVGVGYVMLRIARHYGRFPVPNFFVQFIGGALSLIFGFSMGREGPSVHLGAAGSAFFGQSLNLPNNVTRILVACGAAAAISASFDTPLAGVVFAMEVVLLEYSITGFIPVLVASVSATVFAQIVLGDVEVFSVPDLKLTSFWELPFLILLGFLFGAVANYFIRWIGAIAAFFQNYALASRFMLAGVGTGLLGLLMPEVMGLGYDTLQGVFDEQFSFIFLLAFLLAKWCATSWVVALGLPGGVIGPTVLMGGVLGALVGQIGQALSPEYASNTAFYTMLGMGAMMSATLNAPLAALTAILELTGNSNVILPAMLVIVVANLTTTELFHQVSIFRKLLQLSGDDYRVNPIRQALNKIGVAAVMHTYFASLSLKNPLQPRASFDQSDYQYAVVFDEQQMPVRVLHKGNSQGARVAVPITHYSPVVKVDVTATVEEAWRKLVRSGSRAALVVDEQQVAGLLIIDDITELFNVHKEEHLFHLE